MKQEQLFMILAFICLMIGANYDAAGFKGKAGAAFLAGSALAIFALLEHAGIHIP